MSEMLVRLEKPHDMVLERLTALGIYRTKTEAIRAGILELGKEYEMFDDIIKQIEEELAIKKMTKISTEIDNGKRKLYSEEQVKKKYGFK